MTDKPQRSFIKAVSWRMTGSVDTILVSWLVTRKFTVAITIGGVEVFTKIFLYFLHERVWDKIEFGRRHSNPPEYNI